MDRIRRAAERLWGNIGEQGALQGPPVFASELASFCDWDLSTQTNHVSKWSVGQQLEHIYLSTHYVLDQIEAALTGENADRHMGFWGVGLMAGGFIPRYVFPTIPPLEPKSGTPLHIDPLRERLTDRVEQIAWTLQQLKSSPGKSRHPRMKYLTASQWLFFADVHHRHHLSLMRDIAKAAGREHVARNQPPIYKSASASEK